MLAGASDSLRVVIGRPRFIWGRDDSTLLPPLAAASKGGQLKWFGGGDNLISHVHVENCNHGLILCAEKGANKGIYFLTDGKPTTFREFVSEMLKSVGVEPPPASATLPMWLASAIATGSEWFAWLTGGTPVVTNGVLALMAQEVTVNDSKARKELGYENVISVEEGMKDLATRHAEGLI